MCPRRRDVEGEDLGALIGRPDGKPIRADDADVQVVVGIGILEPGARKTKVEVQRVRRRKLIVETVEHVLFVPVRVENDKLRRIEEAAAVEPVRRDEISPVLAAVGEVQVEVGAAKRAIGGRDAAMWRRGAKARTRAYVDHEAGLVSELGGRRSADDRHRLHGVERNLVGKYLALLVRDRLAIERKRVLSMVAHTVKESIGICLLYTSD